MIERSIFVASDNWLAAIFDYPVFRAVLVEAAPAPDYRPLESLPSYQRCFLYARLDTSDVAGVQMLEDTGFRLVDTNVQLQRARRAESSASPAAEIRFAAPQDRAAVVQLAASSFSQSRFHLDPQIPRELADRIKAEWAGNFFTGKRGQAMVVAEHGGSVVGFLQLLHPTPGNWVIDLIGVSVAARGRGLGSQMISFAELHCPDCELLTVGTQAANTQSLQFYERNGFRIHSSNYVLHSHSRPPA